MAAIVLETPMGLEVSFGAPPGREPGQRDKCDQDGNERRSGELPCSPSLIEPLDCVDHSSARPAARERIGRLVDRDKLSDSSEGRRQAFGTKARLDLDRDDSSVELECPRELSA